MVVRLVTKLDQTKARTLIEAHGLRYEDDFDVLLGVFENDELIATAARKGPVFKMLCIDDRYQGVGLLGELITELINSCSGTGIENFFVFTKPEHSLSFRQFSFNPLVNHQKLCLLEYGHGLQRYLDSHRALIKPGNNGAVVVNCNPFTLGHRYLIEEASRQVDHLYVFVVSEDRSSFPFDIRLHLVREGVSDLDNVSVLDTSDYAISQVTFPGYFLKQDDDPETLQMEIDLMLFGRHIAPFFSIGKRFIGTEPYCVTTRRYNEIMTKVLKNYAVETVQLERKQVADEAISASRVREALKNGTFDILDQLVPDTTLRYLRSHPMGEQLNSHKCQGRH